MNNPRQTRDELLSSLGIRNFDSDIRSFDGPTLLRHFGSPRSGHLVTSRLVRNLAHQAWRDIRSGVEEPVKGNVRSFWYRFVKPAVLRVPKRDRNATQPDEITSLVLADLIAERRLYDYEDFGFTDENWRNRQVGLARPHVLAFAEKAAHVRLLVRLNHKLGMSFVALGGSPSACTSEFTAKQVAAALPRGADGETAPVHLVGLVDYDPSGTQIAESFASQLRSFGLSVGSLVTVPYPRDFAPGALVNAALPVKADRGGTQWLAAGGGIDGELRGFSVESLPDSKLEALMHDAIIAVAPHAVPIPAPPGRDLADFDAARTIVIRPQELHQSLLSEVALGKQVVVVDGGRVVAVLSQ